MPGKHKGWQKQKRAKDHKGVVRLFKQEGTGQDAVAGEEILMLEGVANIFQPVRMGADNPLIITVTDVEFDQGDVWASYEPGRDNDPDTARGEIVGDGGSPQTGTATIMGLVPADISHQGDGYTMTVTVFQLGDELAVVQIPVISESGNFIPQ